MCGCPWMQDVSGSCGASPNVRPFCAAKSVVFLLPWRIVTNGRVQYSIVRTHHPPLDAAAQSLDVKDGNLNGRHSEASSLGRVCKRLSSATSLVTALLHAVEGCVVSASPPPAHPTTPPAKHSCAKACLSELRPSGARLGSLVSLSVSLRLHVVKGMWVQHPHLQPSRLPPAFFLSSLSHRSAELKCA
jgi:hypothetical protein